MTNWTGKNVSFRHEGNGHKILGLVIDQRDEEDGAYLTIQTLGGRVYEDVSERLDEVEAV